MMFILVTTEKGQTLLNPSTIACITPKDSGALVCFNSANIYMQQLYVHESMDEILDRITTAERKKG